MVVATQTPWISAHYLHWLYDYVRRQGADPESALGVLLPQEESPVVPIAQWREYLDRAAVLLNDPDLGLHFGQTIGPQHFGVPGYLLHYCDNFGHAVQRLTHFRMLFFNLSKVSILLEGDSHMHRWLSDTHAAHYQEEVFTIVAAVQFGRVITGKRLSPQGVGLMSAKPADCIALENFLGCPAAFSQEENWIRGSASAWAMPTVQPDANLRSLLEKQAESLLASLPMQDELVRVVRRHIIALMSEGEPTQERVAVRLNMSARTLHRQLAQRDCRFRDVLEQTRRQLAESWLRDPRLSLPDIALLLGYAEQSPFTHAFKRWTGSTPSEWRRGQRGKTLPDR